MTEDRSPKENTSDDALRRSITRRGVQILCQFILIAALLFLSSGRLRWSWAWLYLGISTLQVVVNLVFMLKNNPDLIAERATGSEKTQDWDRVIARISGPLWFIIFIVAGLDERWNLSSVPVWISLISLTVFLVGSALTSWAMLTNEYFSTAVRIQEDKGHRVISYGPYRWIRHPGYLGWGSVGLAMPLMFGSIWALIPAVLVLVAIVVRTALEDRMLRAELTGYAEYARRVRFRLVPGLW
jgi:protein-S-isoprenylcysteine O-methyltransferase Ste14